MKRLLLLLLLFASSARAQDFIQNYSFVTTGTKGPGTSFANTGVSSFFMSWSPQTSMNTCSIQADSSSDGSSWGSGDLIASQSCTTVGSATTATLGTGKNFVRVNVTVMSGNGGLNVTLKGWGGGGGVTPNSPLPASSSGPGPVFNVKNYGAKGDTQESANGSISNFTITCTDCVFTAADVNKSTSCSVGSGTYWSNLPIISVTNSTTAVIGSSFGAAPCFVFTWGTLDDAAVLAATTAMLAQMKTLSGTGNLGIPTAAATLYFPSGNYSLLTAQISINPAAARSGVTILGDGSDQSRVISLTGYAPSTVLLLNGNVGFARVKGLTFDGMLGSSFGTTITANASAQAFDDVTVQRFGGNAVSSQSTIFFYNSTIFGNTGVGFQCQPCNGESRATKYGNNGGGNIIFNGVSGAPAGAGFKLYGGLVDECGSATACTTITNSQDVWFIGGSFFGTPNGSAIQVDANSYLHINGGIVGVFSADSNTGGLKILAGGVVEETDVRNIASGTSKCINNAGSLFDNGANSCESQFTIISGTSTGTTAVLTLTNQGAAVNTNCSVGDALFVEGANPAGYDGYSPAGATSGITAVTATTLTYTTTGSNLGAAGAAGAAFCRNLQTYTGSLPRALLNNPIPNTCYVTITPIVNATNYLMCNWRVQNAANITRIMASSQNVTTCATAPIITISDGTATQTLTLTTGKQQWDSAVDTSTGVGTTIFKPNGTITVRYDVAAASACATPPTQLSVSFNISPILSN